MLFPGWAVQRSWYASRTDSGIDGLVSYCSMKSLLHSFLSFLYIIQELCMLVLNLNADRSVADV
jgi:hypothetical protein